MFFGVSPHSYQEEHTFNNKKEAVPTYVEPAETTIPEKTASPMGVVGLISGLGFALTVLRRK